MTYLERVDWPAGVRPPCPLCGALTTGLREVEVPRRSTGSRADHQPILVLAEPCECEVTESAALLQHDAILLEHDLAQGLARPLPLPSRRPTADPARSSRRSSGRELRQALLDQVLSGREAHVG
jgi:hypothetical protein